MPFDSALIEQVLINLLENATKYTPPGSPIEVTARVRRDWVEVEVADRGPGVAPKDAERVFDKFYRVREGEGGGVGLGPDDLPRHRRARTAGASGSSRATGGGASFRFTLPLQSGAPSASLPASRRAPRPRPRR